MTDAMTHSEAESLAAFVDGSLSGEELANVQEHLQNCEECRLMIGEAVAFERHEQAQARRHWWNVAAAALAAVAVLGGGGVVIVQYQTRQEILVAARDFRAAKTPNNQRAFTARLSEQESYGNEPSRFRDTEQRKDLDRKNPVVATAFALMNAAGDGDSLQAVHARALGEAVVQSPSDAVQTITQGIPENRRNAKLWNDIAVLQLAAHQEADALTSVERALRQKPAMPEALFNRAVILTELKDRGAAIDPNEIKKAWQAYRNVDSTSEWAAEAKKNLDQ